MRLLVHYTSSFSMVLSHNRHRGPWTSQTPTRMPPVLGRTTNLSCHWHNSLYNFFFENWKLKNMSFSSFFLTSWGICQKQFLSEWQIFWCWNVLQNTTGPMVPSTWESVQRLSPEGFYKIQLFIWMFTVRCLPFFFIVNSIFCPSSLLQVSSPFDFLDWGITLWVWLPLTGMRGL